MSKPAGERWTIAVDFDGVLHSYTSSWVNEHTIPDPPVPGAIEWLNEIAESFKVVIFTTRGKSQAGIDAVRVWLWAHGARLASAENEVEVTDRKPAALVYLDDRAMRFDGKTWPSAHEIHAAKPWNKP